MKKADLFRKLEKIIENSKLTEREVKILKLRFGLSGCKPQTLQAVGDIFHVTRERIRIIEAVALRKISLTR